ncbi:aminodeoxychorismate lyase [Pseudonocardia sp. TRM90224]|uniref:aminodeoxychorismate lyase n=1 Tax=Pseudonocardia sp. TRM90224 TaxID=2812678 RepID=UPI001E334A57|nr:aminodeoxychorismate lyase [Pseudonocardia sp. TRM90224]
MEFAGLLVTASGIVDRAQPLLRADDLGVLRGDGVFERLLIVDGEPDLFDEHLQRLERSAVMTGLRLPPPESWRKAIAIACDEVRGLENMSLRMIVTRGVDESGDEPSWYVLVDQVSPAVLAKRTEGIAAVTLDRGLDPELTERAPWLLMGAKTLSYAVNMAAQRWAREHDADDAIFVAPDGQVLEAPTSAVVIARGRTLLSPPPSVGILPSITLGRLFRAASGAGWETRLEPFVLDDLHTADGVWLVSSIRLASRVHTLDGKALTCVAPHDEIAALSGPFRA